MVPIATELIFDMTYPILFLQKQEDNQEYQQAIPNVKDFVQNF